MHLERGLALQAGVDQQVTLPGHGQVQDGQRQRAVAGRPQAAHVLATPHRVDDHRAVLSGSGSDFKVRYIFDISSFYFGFLCFLTRDPDTAMSSSVLMLTLSTSSVCPYKTWTGLGQRPTGAPPCRTQHTHTEDVSAPFNLQDL